MYGEKHNLVNEFPEYKEAIHGLKLNDQHFARLFDRYHVVDQEVYRIEQGIENPADDYTEQLKKERLALKDSLLKMIKA